MGMMTSLGKFFKGIFKKNIPVHKPLKGNAVLKYTAPSRWKPCGFKRGCFRKRNKTEHRKRRRMTRGQ